MCRSIKPLFNFEPPATEEEIHAASLQFVRKLSGMNKPSTANQDAFDRAVDDIAASARALLESLRHNIRAEKSRNRSRARTRPLGRSLRPSHRLTLERRIVAR